MANVVVPKAKPAAVHFGGLCEPTNPGGWACWGWAALDSDGDEVANSYGVIGKAPCMTDSLAEYHALIFALFWLRDQGYRGVPVRGDSRLVVGQVNGECECRQEHLICLRDGAQRLKEETLSFLDWVPREENAAADRYSRMAYEEVLQTHNPDWQNGSQILDPRPDLREDARLWRWLLREAKTRDREAGAKPRDSLLRALVDLRRLGARLEAVGDRYRIWPTIGPDGWEDWGAWKACVKQYPALRVDRVVRLLAALEDAFPIAEAA